MRKSALVTALAVSLALSIGEIRAQDFQTAYFLKNYVYSYHISPASMPENNKLFFGLLVDNVSLDVNSNVGVDSFFFPVVIDGRKTLVSGFNENVSAEQFLGKLNDRNAAVVGTSLNILSFGYKKKNNDSFHSYEINARMNVSAGVPQSLFSLLKLGGTVPGTYSGSNVCLNTTDYIELSTGHSYKLNDNVRLGGKVKLLVGVADLKLAVSSFEAVSTDVMRLRADGGAHMHVLGTEFSTNQDGYIDFGFDNSDLKPGGYGAAVDFGVEYKIPSVNGLIMTASVQDLGGIYWLNGTDAHAEVGGNSGSLDAEGLSLDHLFKKDASGKNEFLMLGPSLNFGVNYDVVRMLSVGALATARLGRYATYEGRIGLAFTPHRVFSMAASAGVNNFGAGIGLAMSLNVPGVNFFAGTDSIIWEFSPEFIPIRKLHTRLNLGLVIAL